MYPYDTFVSTDLNSQSALSYHLVKLWLHNFPLWIHWNPWCEYFRCMCFLGGGVCYGHACLCGRPFFLHLNYRNVVRLDYLLSKLSVSSLQFYWHNIYHFYYPYWQTAQILLSSEVVEVFCSYWTQFPHWKWSGVEYIFFIIFSDHVDISVWNVLVRCYY